MKLLYWKDDPAAANIMSFLPEFKDRAIESPKSVLFLEEEDSILVENENADFFVVPSTHRSESQRKSLTLHTTGNFGTADLGGRVGEMQYTNPGAIKVGLQSLAKQALEDYDVALEVTHHGPTTLKQPLLFIETGSTEPEWTDPKAGEAIANAIRAIDENTKEFDNYIGFGGLHYANAFTPKVIESTDVAIGHIAPKYAIEALTEEIVQEMLKKSYAERALIDWKGLKSEPRKKVVGILDSLGVEWKKTGEV